MRNRLAHDYEGVKLEIVWDTALVHVPILLDAIESIVRKRDAPGSASASPW